MKLKIYTNIFNTFLLLCITLISLAQQVSALSFDDLALNAAQQANGRRGNEITNMINGYKFDCQFQDIYAEVTVYGTIIHSVSATEGQGKFSIVPFQIGRYENITLINSIANWVSNENETVRIGRNNIIEELNTSADGIRQDFIIKERPHGTGKLRLILSLKGANSSIESDNIMLEMQSGRKLIYSKLYVDDARGKKLKAWFRINRKSEICIEVNDKNAEYPIRIDPTIVDPEWIAIGGKRLGTNGNVNAVVVDTSGNIYVGGSFTAVGGDSARYIAKWNGSSWQPVGAGVNDTVCALAIDNKSIVYAGGWFTLAGGKSANYIAKWDGVSWAALGSGMNSSIRALATDSKGNLFAGGDFTNAGGVSTNRIARWNGTTWSALGTGMGSNTFPRVLALTVDKNNILYAAGDFTTAGGATANYLARWDSVSWSALGQGMNNIIYALATDSSGILYAGGNFTTADGIIANRIAKWNGSSWSAMGSGMNSNVFALCVDDSNNLYAGGEFSTVSGVTAEKIAKWNGTSWSAVGTETYSSILALTVDKKGDLFAGGTFETAGGVRCNRIAKWNGSYWCPLGFGMDRSVRAITIDSSGNLYIGGSFKWANTIRANHIAKWDGSSWSSLGSGVDLGVYEHRIYSLVADKKGNIYAGGGFTVAGGVSINSVAKWNGSTWTALGTGITGNEPIVYALAIDNKGNLYAGGGFTTVGGVNANNIAKWDGSSWSALGTGTGGSYKYVFALAVDDKDNLFAGGYFTTAGGVSANRIAKWDGVSWSSLGSGVSGTSDSYNISALLIGNDGNLYAGGFFNQAGNVSTLNIAKWNGTEWSSLGKGVSGGEYASVYALSRDNKGTLYAGGSFTTTGEINVNRIAKWDGIQWGTLGSGVEFSDPSTSCDVLDLAIDPSGNIFVCGSFLVAGGKPSSYVAQYNPEGVNINKKQSKNFHADFISVTGKGIRFYLNKPEIVKLQIFTFNGKLASFQDLGMLNSGFNNISLRNHKLANGRYIITISTKSRSIKVPFSVIY